VDYIPPRRGEPVVEEDRSFTLRVQTFLEDLASASSGTNTNYVVANAAITAGTGTKITYDTKGLVLSSTYATTTDVPEGSNMYYTDERVLNVINSLGIIADTDYLTVGT